MGRKTTRVMIDRDEINRLVKESRFKNVTELTTEMGMARHGIGESVTVSELKLMSLLLGVDEDALKYKAKSASMPGAAEVFQSEAIMNELETLKEEIKSLRNDLHFTAKAIIEITKTGNETKAQAELNAETLASLHTKASEINGNLTKLYAKSIKKY